MAELTIYVNNDSKIIFAETGQTLLSALQTAGITQISAPCGGNGKCGKCGVMVEGSLSPIESTEKGLISEYDNQRLACRAKIEGDCTIHLFTADHFPGLVVPNPNTRIWNCSPMQPGNICLEHEKDAVSIGQWISDYTKPDRRQGIGAAVDIGTTTIALYLVDLKTGELLSVVSGMNCQRAFGTDVISRVQYSIENDDGLNRLANAIRRQVVEYLDSACAESGRKIEEIQEICIAGNTIMEHIFAGISPKSIALAPFKPISLFGESLTAAQLGLAASMPAIVYLSPCVSGYVGGDITAGLFVSGACLSKRPCLFLDIGTNGEIALGGSDGFLCCATAAGPAFEGAEIACGLSGVNGAVSHVWLQNGDICYQVIGGGAPTGICGSGLVDALAMLLDMGGVDKTGRLLPADDAPAVIRPSLGIRKNRIVFYLDAERTIFISEKDVRELQLAKAAIAAGIQTLLNEEGLCEEDVDTLYIAGGFGNYMNKDNAAAIGLIPRALVSKSVSVGNSAGMGAIAALMSESSKEGLEEIRKRCKYMELSNSEVFSERFIDCMMFE